MMRSPNSYTVSVRRPDGQIVIKEQAWHSIWSKLKFLRWPFFRGTVVLIEAMWNGISALTFAANHAIDEEEEQAKKKVTDVENNEEEAKTETVSEEDEDSVKAETVNGGVLQDKKAEPVLGPLALVGTIIVSFAFALGLFVALPHALTAWFGFDVESVWFHAVDGVVKVVFFIAYVWGISFIKDIRRVFEYHGAEHMSIFAFEEGKELTLENVRPYSTYHPRCGTSFIMVVLLISILLFSVTFPFLPKFPDLHKVLVHLIYICIKIPMMLPVAGISYELIKFAGKKQDNKLLKIAVLPGLLLQRITTKRPDDSQLEVAILSLKKCIWRESNLDADGMETVIFYDDFDHAVQSIEKNAEPQSGL